MNQLFKKITKQLNVTDPGNFNKKKLYWQIFWVNGISIAFLKTPSIEKSMFQQGTTIKGKYHKYQDE